MYIYIYIYNSLCHVLLFDKLCYWWHPPLLISTAWTPASRKGAEQIGHWQTVTVTPIRLTCDTAKLKMLLHRH